MAAPIGLALIVVSLVIVGTAGIILPAIRFVPRRYPASDDCAAGGKSFY